jgi:hypothetical protein
MIINGEPGLDIYEESAICYHILHRIWFWCEYAMASKRLPTTWQSWSRHGITLQHMRRMQARLNNAGIEFQL